MMSPQNHVDFCFDPRRLTYRQHEPKPQSSTSIASVDLLEVRSELTAKRDSDSEIRQ